MEWLGWLAAMTLLTTLFAQVRRNWKERKLKGVSPWLYYGQALASLCFAVYSLTINSWVFVVTNALSLMAAIIGIYLLHRYREPENAYAADGLDHHPRAQRREDHCRHADVVASPRR